MKIKSILLVIIPILFAGSTVTASDLNLDFIRNQAFENRLYTPPAPREINLFSNKDKKSEKTSTKVEVENLTRTANPDKVNLTDKDFIKKYKEANNPFIRRKQFDINVEKEPTDKKVNKKSEKVKKQKEETKKKEKKQKKTKDIIIEKDVITDTEVNQSETIFNPEPSDVAATDTEEPKTSEEPENKDTDNQEETVSDTELNNETTSDTEENQSSDVQQEEQAENYTADENALENVSKNENTESTVTEETQKEELPEEKNILAGDESTTYEDNSDKTFDPSNKTFFSDAQKQKLKEDQKRVKKEKRGLFRKKKKEETYYKPSNLILTSDYTDYYPERFEVESIGNAKLQITGEKFELYADKIVLNHETNTVRAYDNVKIIQGENITTGDFINLDMNTAHGWIQKPVSANYSVRIKAKEAYVLPDKIEEYDGVANILEDRRIQVGSGSYASLLDRLKPTIGDAYLKKPEPTTLKFKVKEIDVKSKDGHNVITMKNIGMYYKKFKVGVLPHLKLVADKEQTYMQTNLPELGSDSNMGMYIGPSIVLNTPFSSTLKISPLLVYSQDEKKMGWGAAATYMSDSNVTQMAYGSPEDKFMLRGYQSITPRLRLNYSQNMYISQWFMGYRRPMYSAELEYSDKVYIKDLGAQFEHRLIGGVYSDYARISKLAEGRLRYMTQLQKNLYTFTNSANTFSLDIGIVGQGVVSQYTTGDTFGIARIAPSIRTTYRGWSQNLLYFQSGASGSTPFKFDDYYYGKSNLQILEVLRLNKYLTIGYLGSLAVGGRETYSKGRYRDTNRDLFQENMFLVSIGPDEAKVTLSYDAVRKTTAVYFTMLLGTKDMDVAFKKSTIQDPDKLNGENKKVPYIKDTFNKVRYKVFPLTNPEFVKSRDLYPEEKINKTINEDESVDETIDQVERQELQQQIKNQFSPFIQNQELLRDNRM